MLREKKSDLVVGAMYIPRWCIIPEKEYARDIANMKKSGLNAVNFWAEWNLIEPDKAGYDFRNLDRLVGLAVKNRLQIVMTVDINSIPFWVMKKYPDAKPILPDNYAYIPSGLWNHWGLCLDHKNLKETVEKFLNKLVSRYLKESFYWVVLCEPELPECVCPHTLGEFKSQMKKKYRSLANLSDVWRCRYTEWNQIDPPRLHQRSGGNSERWIDWHSFRTQNLANHAKWLSDIIKRLSPESKTIAHPGGATNVFHNTAISDWKLAESVDIFGVSYYPKGWLGEVSPQEEGALLDAIRSEAREKPVWMGEFQGGQHITSPADIYPVPTPQEMWHWNWEAFAHGAEGMLYWIWRPMLASHENGGFGVTDRLGNITERARTIGKFTKTAHRLQELCPGLRRAQAEVAIFHSEETGILSKLENVPEYPGASTMGYYSILWQSKIPVDFITPKDILLGRLTKYKTLILPFAYTMSRDAGGRIADFVQSGGVLLGEAFCALRDEHGRGYPVIPGAGLDKVFGCQETDRRKTDKTELFLISDDCKNIKKISVEGIRQTFKPDAGGKLLANFKDGGGAIITAHKGKTLLAGVQLGMVYQKYRAKAIADLIIGFLKNAGITAPVCVSGDKESREFIEIQRFENDEQDLIMILNHGLKPIQTILEIQCPEYNCRLRNLLTGTAIPFKKRGSRISFPVKIEALDILFVAVSKRGSD